MGNRSSSGFIRLDGGKRFIMNACNGCGRLFIGETAIQRHIALCAAAKAIE